MVDRLEHLRSQIEALCRRQCRRHHVRRLELFGSAATGTLGPESDVDFLVDFSPLGQGQYAEHYCRDSGADLDLEPEHTFRLLSGAKQLDVRCCRADYVPLAPSQSSSTGRTRSCCPPNTEVR